MEELGPGPRLGEEIGGGSRTIESLSLYLLLKGHDIIKGTPMGSDARSANGTNATKPVSTFHVAWEEIHSRMCNKADLADSLKDLCDSVTALQSRLEGFGTLRRCVEFEVDRHSAKTLYDRLSVAVILLCRISATCDSIAEKDYERAFQDALVNLDECQWPPENLDELFKLPETEWLEALKDGAMQHHHGEPRSTSIPLRIKKFRSEIERLHDQLWRLTYLFYSSVTPSITNEWQPTDRQCMGSDDPVAVRVRQMLSKPDYEMLLEELQNIHIGVQTLQSVQGTISAHVSQQSDALGSLEANTAQTHDHTDGTKDEIAALVRSNTGYWQWNGAAIGASLGAVMGLLLGPVGAVVGCAAGGAAGTAAGKALRERRLSQVDEAMCYRPRIEELPTPRRHQGASSSMRILPVGIGGCPVSTGMRPKLF